jgi:hypothetical protein
VIAIAGLATITRYEKFGPRNSPRLETCYQDFGRMSDQNGGAAPLPGAPEFTSTTATTAAAAAVGVDNDNVVDDVPRGGARSGTPADNADSTNKSPTNASATAANASAIANTTNKSPPPVEPLSQSSLSSPRNDIPQRPSFMATASPVHRGNSPLSPGKGGGIRKQRNKY